MPAVSISPIFNGQVVTSAAAPASGWKIYSYIAGSTTSQPTYTDSTGSVAHANPVILDSNGFTQGGALWLANGTAYKLVLTNETDVVQKTIDDVEGVNDTALASISQWVATGQTPTFLTSTTFSMTGDQTAEFHVGRRLQAQLGVGFVYGTITASTFSTGVTTVTLKMDDAQVLNNALTAVNLSLLRADHHALPKVALDLISLNVDTSINAQTINLTGALNRAPQGTIASAPTTDLFTVNADSILVTGVVTISSFGVAPAGVVRTVEFQDALTLTYNATSLILPGSTSITTAAGDVMQIYSKGSGNWKVIAYTTYSQSPGAGGGNFSVPSMQVFSTPGNFNFTVPAGKTRVRVTVAGGGQCGRISTTYGGGTAIKTITGLTPGQVIPVVVGAGGVYTSGEFGPAQNGGTSSFGSFCSATGSTWNPPSGLLPLPGNGVNGDINIIGGIGITVTSPDTGDTIFIGGGSFLTGMGTAPYDALIPANAYGAGGGALLTTSGAGSGTSGGRGVVIVEY